MKNANWARLRGVAMGVLAGGGLSAAATPLPTGVQIVSLMPAFFEASERATPDERAAALHDHVFKVAPDLYGPIITVLSEKDLADHLERLKPYDADIRTLSRQIEAQIPRSIQLLKRDLGGLRPMKIYVAPSLFTSNGQVRMSATGPIVAFGPDVHAYAVKELMAEHPPYDVRALVGHELFHAQHYAANSEMAGMANRLFGADRPALIYNLWIEGLATCESMRLDGDGTVLDGLMSKELAAMTTRDAKVLASEMGAKLGSTSEQDYNDYFWLSGKRTDVPKRSGYGFGVLVADQVVKKIGIRRAVALRGPALKAEVLAAIKSIGSRKYILNWSRVCPSVG